MQLRTKKALLLITPIITTAFFLAVAAHVATAPPTIKIEYKQTQRDVEGEFVLVNFNFKITLQNSKEVLIDVANFTLNGFRPVSVTRYPCSLQVNKETVLHLAFTVPSNITEYKFAYTGLEGYNIIFNQV